METERNFSLVPPIFDGENYHACAIKMSTYLEALDLWEAVEEEYDKEIRQGRPKLKLVYSMRCQAQYLQES